ncbi:hypothetical protein [Nocardia sp. XZ_19_369]|uniref:hypothetical protein n=1 Tax=Nocardia sp. XZ_19_369 TaxID=2769487 RepID=UPI00188E2FC1|nr:hypothetical protein [Nocardia sp. XZ_19_369]
MDLAEKARMGLQSVTVKGQLRRADQPSSSKESTVRLVNKRVSQDDARTAFPAADGTFMVTLQVDRLTTMSPEIHVYTACVTTTPCQRRIRFPVPDKYINSQTPYDLGTVHLEAKQPDEEPVC